MKRLGLTKCRGSQLFIDQLINGLELVQRENGRRSGLKNTGVGGRQKNGQKNGVKMGEMCGMKNGENLMTEMEAV